MSGRDVIGIAETGSGKTLAYVLPMTRHIRDQSPVGENEGMIGLVMAPTRELAFQIYKESKAFARACGIRVVCVYGGANVAGQLSDLKRGAEIVVCTPGRMIDVLTTSNGRITNLKRCSYIVLDEADRMLDMGFEP
jgi:ATP-dependent RNA helicase DDX46/PRP5